MEGFIKIMRELKDKTFYSKDSEKVHLWLHLLLSANWKEKEELLGGKPILCKAGQFTTGRKQLSIQTGINESKIERILTYFEKIEQQIEQQKTNTNRLISILNWDKFQLIEQPIKQRVNNKRTTSEQQVNTLEEYKEDKEYKDVIARDKKFISEISKHSENYHKDILNSFYLYWSEKTAKGDKMKFELQKTFEISKRLAYWSANDNKFGNKNEKPKQPKSNVIRPIDYLIPKDDYFGYDNAVLIQRCVDGCYKKKDV